MREQNRDNFYEGPPLEDERTWHDGAVVGDGRDELGADAREPRPESQRTPSSDLVDVDMPDRGAYPMPSVIERPHATDNSMSPPGPLMRDTSLSRAADRDAVGAPVDEAGYDRSIEGEPAGPLAPDATAAPPGGGGQDEPEGGAELPAGQYGSSGSPP